MVIVRARYFGRGRIRNGFGILLEQEQDGFERNAGAKIFVRMEFPG